MAYEKENLRNALIANSKRNLEEILPQIRIRNCILFLGAGISQDAGYAGSADIASYLYDKSKTTRMLEEGEEEFLTLAEAARIYEDEGGGHTRRELVARISEALKPSPETVIDPVAHDLIAHIPQLNGCVITTNWDTLLEDSIEKAAGIKPVVVIEDLDTGKTTGAKHVVYKIHGSLEAPETVVVTPADYRRMYAQLRSPQSLLFAMLRSILAQKVVIYIGYSLSDSDFEELLNNVQQSLTNEDGSYIGNTHYAVMWLPPNLSIDELRRLHYEQRRCEGKRIKIIWQSAREFSRYVFEETSEFVNREKELHQLTQELIPKYSCLELTGNAGSGKTRLLQELVDRYKHEFKWLKVCYIDLQELKPEEEVEEKALVLGLVAKVLRVRKAEIDAIKGLGGLFLAFDSVERTTDTIRETIIELAKEIDALQKKDRKIIWATRYSLFQHLPLSLRYRTFSFPLSTFDETSVAEMVRRYVEVIGREKKEPEAYKELARTILDLVGSGHPGFVVKTLGILQDKDFSSVFLQQKTIRKLVLKSLTEMVQEDILPDDDKASSYIKDNLCVFRGLTRSMLNKFVAYEPYDKVEQLFQTLMATDLWNMATYPLFKFDPVIRHVLVWYLRETSTPDNAEDHFTRVNEWARGYFEGLLGEHSEDLQRAYFTEWLYHEAMCYPPSELFAALSLEEQEETFRQIEDKLKEKITILKSFDLRGMCRKLALEIRQDLELYDTLTCRVTDVHYDSLLNAIERGPQ